MDLTSVIGGLPYRMALAGGWIDQPFVSRLNPSPPGSMVVVSLEPTVRFMDRCGMATGTRKVAQRLWHDSLPRGARESLTRELYEAENAQKAQPSGSQDMIGILYPGISRLDYDAGHGDGIFPARVESLCDPRIVSWLESIVNVVPVNQRPAGYDPLGVKHLEPEWIRRLGETGRNCFDAIATTDIRGLGASMNECMRCWEHILPCTVRHPTIEVDLTGLLQGYQARYPGAMYSGCGGGYLYVASEEPVPGSFHITVRVS